MRSQNGNLYFIGGINGVGKSTFIKSVLSTKHRKLFKGVSGSTMLMHRLGITGKIYSLLEKRGEQTKRIETIKIMANLIKSHCGKVTILLDAHYFHFKNGRAIDATGPWMKSFTALFTIDANPRTILKRMSRGHGRILGDRDSFPRDRRRVEAEKILNFYRKATIKKMIQIARKYKIPCFTIHNDGNISETVCQFLAIHKTLATKLPS